MSVSYYDYDGWRIRYLETGRGATEGESRHGDADAPVVLLVHGAPGNLDAFKRTLNDPALTARARLISVDRPGYGSSGYGRPETSVSRQAEIIAQVVGAAGGRRPVVVVGHSYGATIAARMAADYPELVGGLVLVSPAVDPNHEVLFFFNSWLEWKPLNRAVPGSIRVANAEKVMHVAELELLKPVLELVTARTIILHGTRDRLVPVENAGFAHRMLKNAPVELRLYRRMGHLIPFTQNHRVITEAIMDLLS